MMDRAIIIESIGDPRLDAYRDVRDKDLRGHGRLFMVESKPVLLRLLPTPDRLHSIFISRDRLPELEPALSALPPRVPIYTAALDLMTRVAGFHIHRGVLAAGIRPTAADLSLDVAFAPLRGRERLTIVVAEGLTNVDNIGGLFRNAAGFGVDGILLDPMCCDPLYRKAIRVSMGHVFVVPWAISRDWPSDLDRLRDEWGVRVIGAELTSASEPIWTCPLGARRAFVFGSEANGLSPAALAGCDAVAEIPMAPDVPSLNVATSVAVMLAEAARRDLTTSEE